jgi:hypothetical protein
MHCLWPRKHYCKDLNAETKRRKVAKKNIKLRGSALKQSGHIVTTVLKTLGVLGKLCSEKISALGSRVFALKQSSYMIATVLKKLGVLRELCGEKISVLGS